MNAIEQYFHVVLLIMLFKVVPTFKSVDETRVSDHSNESYWTALSCGTVDHVVQGGFNSFNCLHRSFDNFSTNGLRASD